MGREELEFRILRLWDKAPKDMTLHDYYLELELSRVFQEKHMSYDKEIPVRELLGGQLAKQASTMMDITPTKRQQLLEVKKHLQNKLREVDEALDALDENPGVEKVLDLLRRVGV